MRGTRFRTSPARLAVAALSAVLGATILAGCEGVPWDTATADAPSAQAEGTAGADSSRSATPSPEPTAGLNADGSLLLTPRSVGALTIDNTTADIAELTGRDYTAELEGFGGECAGYEITDSGPYRYIGALATSDGADGHIDVYSNYTGHTPDDPPARTAEGIGIGSTEADIVAAYGDRVVYKPSYYEPENTQIFVSDGDFAMAFMVNPDHEVIGWEIGREAQLKLIEGCA